MRRLLPLLALLPAAALAVEPGDVVLSELMIRSQSAPEWVELANVSGAGVSMDGCVLSDGDTDEPLDGLTIPAGGFAVLADDAACVAFQDAAMTTCVHPTDLEYSTLTLNDTGSEELRVVCGGVTIDAVTYDWSAIAPDCTGAATCAAQAAPTALNATDNDVWPENWCIPPASQFGYDTLGREVLATPGAANLCPTAGPPCGVGDAVFTELMVAPPTSTREWFELTVLTPAGCDLHGCELREGPFADPLFEPTNEDWATHVIDAPGNSLPIGLGEYALFAKGAATVVGDPDDPLETDLVYADYRFTTIGFGNSEPGWLHLVCGGTPVDSAPYDWARFQAGCTAGGCSVNLLPSREDPVVNDDLTQWCLPPDTPARPSSTGLPMTGTPGEEGSCQQRTWPGPAQVLFTELMGQPSSGQTGTSIPEFFELSNRGEGEADLTGCRILRSRLDREAGTYAPTSTSSEAVFGTDAEATVLAPGETRVWSRGLCLDGGDPEIQSCVGEELIYGGIELSNSERERLDLFCPDGAGREVLVDRVEYDFTRTGVRSAHSAEFDPSVADAGSLNDEPSEWCEASFLDCYVTNGEGQCNFGTPGVAGECKTTQQSAAQSGVPGCRCDVADRGAGGGLLVWALLLLAPRRRRQ
jgi:hypothetical protein